MEMMPKQIDDFIPLLSVETSTLEAYKCSLEKCKEKAIGRDHPIYYFSEKLNVWKTFIISKANYCWDWKL